MEKYDRLQLWRWWPKETLSGKENEVEKGTCVLDNLNEEWRQGLNAETLLRRLKVSNRIDGINISTEDITVQMDTILRLLLLSVLSL